MTGFSFTSTLLFLSVVLHVVLGQAQFAGGKSTAAIEDVPFIRCEVCRKALKHIKEQVKNLRNDTSKKGKRVDEDDILNIVETSCDPDKKQGGWILNYDIVEKDGGLNIVRHELQQRCRQECKTISKACGDSIGDVDTDLGELLWRDHLSLSKLINKVCYEMTDACTRKIPKFKKHKRNDEVFKAMSDDERKAFDVMKQMKSVNGMPGMEMYSKEDIAQMKEQFSATGDDDSEETSNEPHISGGRNLGLIDTIKATISNLYSRVRNLFSYGGKRTEL